MIKKANRKRMNLRGWLGRMIININSSLSDRTNRKKICEFGESHGLYDAFVTERSGR